MKAILKNYRQSPRKVRLVAGLIKGKKVDEALTELNFLAKRAGEPIQKLLKSAISNAKQNFGMNEENLYIKEITVDKGITLKRSMPRSHGMANRINKRSSHIVLVLAETPSAVKKEVKKVKAPKAPAVKVKKAKK